MHALSSRAFCSYLWLTFALRSRKTTDCTDDTDRNEAELTNACLAILAGGIESLLWPSFIREIRGYKKKDN